MFNVMAKRLILIYSRNSRRFSQNFIYLFVNNIHKVVYIFLRIKCKLINFNEKLFKNLRIIGY